MRPPLPVFLGIINRRHRLVRQISVVRRGRAVRVVHLVQVRVPEVLLGGDHAAVAEWRDRQSLDRTAKRRPDLLQKPPERNGK